MSEHTKPDVCEQATAFDEGRGAAERGLHFKYDCPYTFERFKGMDQAQFDATMRPLMDAWFKGWQQYRDDITGEQRGTT